MSEVSEIVTGSFLKANIQVTQVIEAIPHPESTKLFVCKLKVGGEEEPRTFVAGLQPYFTAEELTSRLIVTILNLKPAKLAGIPSEAMVLCGDGPAKEDGSRSVVTLTPPEGAVVGDIVVPEGFTAEQRTLPDGFLNPKQWSKISKVFRCQNGVATVDGVKLVIEGKGEITTPGCPDGASIQ